jgi:hypothetical protein
MYMRAMAARIPDGFARSSREELRTFAVIMFTGLKKACRRQRLSRYCWHFNLLLYISLFLQ